MVVIWPSMVGGVIDDMQRDPPGRLAIGLALLYSIGHDAIPAGAVQDSARNPAVSTASQHCRKRRKIGFRRMLARLQ